MKSTLRKIHLSLPAIIGLLFMFSTTFLSSPAKAEGSGVYLADADTDKFLDDIADIYPINLAVLPPHLTLVDNYPGGNVGSVVFYLDGVKIRTENQAPFALGGDDNGNFFPYPLTEGVHILVTVYYELKNAQGRILNSRENDFRVVNEPQEITVTPSPLKVTVEGGENTTAQFEISATGFFETLKVETSLQSSTVEFITGPRMGTNEIRIHAHRLTTGITTVRIKLLITNEYYSYDPIHEEITLPVEITVTPPQKPYIPYFTLIDATSDREIGNYYYGVAIDENNPPSSFNLRANTHPSTVGSVVFEYTFQPNGGEKSPLMTRIETVKPYALFGDENGDYHERSLAPGSYLITATPYSLPKGKGKAGQSSTFSIYVPPMPNARYKPEETAKALNAATLEEELPWQEAQADRFSAYPNPFSDQVAITYVAESEGKLSIAIYNLQGVLVENLYSGNIEAKQTLSFNVGSHNLPEGIYVCRVQNEETITSRRLILKR